jgi:hypothetical protein
MAGSVVMIVVLVLFPIVVAMSGAIGAAVIGWFGNRDRDEAYAGTEYYDLAHTNPYIDQRD